jgi:hypothetical protein
MQPGDYSIDVGVREQTDELLKRLEDLPAGSKARLSVPRDAIALRALPDYNVLRDLQRRRQLHLTVVSPESTILGLARIYGFEVENTSPQKRAPVPVAAAEEEQLPWPRHDAAGAAVAAPPPDAAPTYGGAFDTPAPPSNGADHAEPTVAPAPAVSESDWLMTEEFADDHPEFAGAQGGTLDAVLPPSVTYAPASVPRREGRTPDTGAPDDLSPDAADLAPSPAAYTRDAPEPRAPRTSRRAVAGGDRGVAGAVPAAAAGGLLGGMGRMFGRKSPAGSAARPVGDRTFVDRSDPGSARPTVLGSAAAAMRPAPTPLEAGDAAAPVADAGQNGHYAADGAEAPAAATAAAAASTLAEPDVMRPLPPPRTRPTPAPRVARPTSRAQTAPARRGRMSGLVALLGVLLVLLLLGGGIFALNAPALAQATVRIVPKQTASLGQIKIDVPVQLGASAGRGLPGMAAPLAVTATLPLTATQPDDGARSAKPVTAQKINATIVSQKLVKTTGVRQEPDKPAVGTIRFTNRDSAAFTVPSGTSLTAGNGKKFHTVSDVTVPGTDFINQQFGTQSVDIVADEPGPASNGLTLGGGIRNAVFSTLAPTHGGTTKPIATVADKDLADLQALLKADIAARAGQELLNTAAKVDPAATVITCTMPTSFFDNASVSKLPPVGADAMQVYGVMTTTVSVFSFHEAEARHNAALAATEAAPQGLPVEAEIDPASIQEQDLQFTRVTDCDSARVVYQTTVTPRVLYTFANNSAVENQIRDLVVHATTPAEAAAAIKASPYGPYIDSVQVDTSLLGIQQEKLPDTPSNIQIAVERVPSGPLGGGGTAPPNATSPPTGEPK